MSIHQHPHRPQKRTVHWTLSRPNRNAIPVFHPPVWLTTPADPNTYWAGCISERGVVARRAIAITRRNPTTSEIRMTAGERETGLRMAEPRLMKTKDVVNLAR